MLQKLPKNSSRVFRGVLGILDCRALPHYIHPRDRHDTEQDRESETEEDFASIFPFSETVGNTSLHGIIGHDSDEDRGCRDEEGDLTRSSSLTHSKVDRIDISKTRYKTDSIVKYCFEFFLIFWRDTRFLICCTRDRDEFDRHDESRELKCR